MSMEAVFSRDISSLFAAGTPHRTFYHPTPTTPRAEGSRDAAPIKKSFAVTSLSKAHRPPPSTEWSSPSHQNPVWDLKVSTADLSSVGSSRYNESWPSRSDESGCGFEAAVTISPQEGSAESADGQRPASAISKSHSQDSTLARYVERFRQAPPTSRDSRETPASPFWWKEHRTEDTSVLATPPQETSTPNSSKGHLSANSDRTHTTPTFTVSSPGLEPRCQSVIEKATDLFTSASTSDSPPAQKYLNTLRGVQGEQELRPQSSSGLWQQDTGVHAVCPGDDILVQWRLQRKVEQARSESAVWSRCHLGRRDGGVAVDRTGWRGGGVAVDHVGRRDGGVAVDHTDMGVAVGSRDGGVAVDHTDMGVAVDHTDMGVAVGRRDGGVAHHTVNICPVSRIPCCFGRCCRVAEDNGMLGHSSCPLCQHQVKGQGHGSCQHQVKGQDREVQTSPDLVAREQEVSREDGQGRRGSVSSGNWSQGQPGGGCGQPGIGYGQSGSGCGLSGNRCWSKSGAQYSQCSRSEDSFSVELESTAETREQVSKAPPIDHENTPLHGGLALRDLTVSSADELTLTFNTDLGTERCNLGMGRSNTGLERSGMGMQSRTEMERSRMGMEAGDDGSGDTGVEQCMDNSPHSGEASTSTPTKAMTSNGTMAPLQKSDRVVAAVCQQDGFPLVSWDNDMDDELLKLLITKARLFEDQIREIDGLLMEMQEDVQ